MVYYTLVGMEQLSDDFIIEEEMNYNENFQRVWKSFFEPMSKGGFAVYDGYFLILQKPVRLCVLPDRRQEFCSMEILLLIRIIR